jgi:hypothetical protein
MNTFSPTGKRGGASGPSGQQTRRRVNAGIIALRQVDASLSCATVIRLFIYGLPALLLTLIAVAFGSVSLLSTKKKNEMSIGTLGEPSTLNPIQHADAAAGARHVEVWFDARPGREATRRHFQCDANFRRLWEC